MNRQMRIFFSASGIIKQWILLAIVLVVAACSEQLPGISKNNNQQTDKDVRQAHSQIQLILNEVDGFAITLYPLLAENCATCHGEGGMAAPSIAHQDVIAAQAAVTDTQKASFSNPANSRIVVKLRSEFHYCWSVCEEDAQQLQTAIEKWATFTGETGGNGPPADLISSTSLTLADGVLGGGTQRYNDQVIAFYEFKEGTGNIAHDTSGITPALDLTLEGPAWAAGQGIEIQSGIAAGTPETSKKLYDYIAGGATATHEYSVEAWVIPANVTQEGPARLVTYSDGTQDRNFTMGQQTYNYVFRNRSDSPDISPNGTPALQTNNDEQVLQASQQHVVMTFSQSEGRKIFVNGVVKNTENGSASTLTNWNANYTFAVGNETSNNRLFMGVVQLVAVHKQALTPEQVMQNFDAGVGQKFSMKFDVSAVLEQAGNYIQFEVSELDRYSYLFNKPVFLSATPNGFRVKNIQVAVNGQIPVAGQTWRNIDTTITQNEQALFDMAAVISKDAGPETDQFSIIFEILGDKENVIVEEPPSAPVPLDVLDISPRAGVRTFEQVTHTMATITGVDANTGSVKVTYHDLKQQLPSLPNINGFLTSHQVGIAKLALEYCDTLIESNTLREQFFGANSFNFDAPVNNAFANAGQVDQLITTLMDKMLGVGLANQPDKPSVRQELMSLISDLTVGCNNASQCDATRTKSVVKASCAAVLGSAALTIQ